MSMVLGVEGGKVSTRMNNLVPSATSTNMFHNWIHNLFRWFQCHGLVFFFHIGPLLGTTKSLSAGAGVVRSVTAFGGDWALRRSVLYGAPTQAFCYV